MIFTLFLFSLIYQVADGADPDIKIEPQVLFITQRILTVTLTCTYVTSSQRGSAPVWRMNGGIIPPRETSEETVDGIHYSNISRPTSQFSNDTSLTCSIANGRHMASIKVYVLDYMRLNAVGLLSPIYPSKETNPLLICWTPPPVYYTIAYIVGYHINLTDSAKSRVLQHMFVDKATLCWKLTGFRNMTTLFSIAAEYVAGLGQTRQILVSTPASTYNPTSSWNISVEYNRSNESSELYNLTIKWEVNYQWLPLYYHVDLVCLSTFEIKEKIKGTKYTGSDKRLVENGLCTVSIVACMKEGQGATDSAICLWRVESPLHNFTVVLDSTPTSTMNPTVETSTAFKSPSDAELYNIMYIVMALTVFVAGSIAIATGIVACVFWKRRTQSSRHVGGGSGVQYNPYDEEVIISATDDDRGLAEDVGYIAMKSGKRINQPGAKVTTNPNCQEPAYVEIPVKLESKWTT